MFWRRKTKTPDKTPDSETPDSETPDSETSAPETVESETTAPETTAPETGAPVPEAPVEDTPESGSREAKRGWLARLKSGLARSSSKVSDGIGAIFVKRKLDDTALEELEELLIGADLGVGMAGRVTARLAKTRFDKEVDAGEIRAELAGQIAESLTPVAKPLTLDPARRPHVVLVVGVNGSGKTTTIAKLAKQWRDSGHRVHLAAGDTFRAAAVEQLQVWGERTGCPVTTRPTGADAAGLAYDALKDAQAADADVLLIDTAGRLHNKTGLMAELQKIIRVLAKLDPSAPHDTLLVLDATVGQNALQQVQTFKELVNVTGLAVTKLDGSARGGVLVPLAEKFGLPVHMIGVGESAEDLRPFAARPFARALVGLDPEG